MPRVVVWALVAALAAALGTTFSHLNYAPAMDDPSKLPPRKLQIALGQTVRDFMQTNGLPAQSGRSAMPDVNNYAVALDVIADTSPIIFGDHWIALAFKVGPQIFELPSGRTLFIDQEAGRIKSFSLTPYQRALPLMQTNQLVKPLLDQFLAQGWTPKVANSLTFALTDGDADFARSGQKIYGQLRDSEGNLMNLTVTNLASVASQPAYILAPSHQRPVHQPPVYVIRLGFYWAHDGDLSYGDLVYPRRIFVNGNRNQPLSLRPWVEDPEWTPGKHGMIDQGGSGEGRRWVMPGK